MIVSTNAISNLVTEYHKKSAVLIIYMHIKLHKTISNNFQDNANFVATLQVQLKVCIVNVICRGEFGPREREGRGLLAGLPLAGREHRLLEGEDEPWPLTLGSCRISCSSTVPLRTRVVVLLLQMLVCISD